MHNQDLYTQSPPHLVDRQHLWLLLVTVHSSSNPATYDNFGPNQNNIFLMLTLKIKQLTRVNTVIKQYLFGTTI